jgi:DNA-binding LytR/AlgR family response regulator
MITIQKNYDDFEIKLAKLTEDEDIFNYTIEYRNYLVSNNPEKALQVVKKVYERYEYQNDNIYRYKLLLCYSSTLIVLEQFKEALEYMLDCISFFTKTNDNKSITIAIGNTASIFFRLEMFSYALYLWKVVLTKYIDPKNKYLVNVTKGNIMMTNLLHFNDIVYSLETIEDIIYYYKQKKDINRSELYLMLSTKHNLARFYALQKNNSKAIEIMENLIEEYIKEEIIADQINVYYELGILYKKENHEIKMVGAFNKVIQLGESLNQKLLFSNIFYELYEFYKIKDNHKKALQSIEKYHEYKQIEIDLKNSAQQIIKDIGLEGPNFDSNTLNIFKNNANLYEFFVFCEDNNDSIIKIDIFEILYAIKENNYIKIYMSNSDILYVKSSFKKLFFQLNNAFNNYKLFFDINSRDTFINLFWISKINFNTKRVFIRPFHNEVSFQVSKRQWQIFKEIVKH